MLYKADVTMRDDDISLGPHLAKIAAVMQPSKNQAIVRVEPIRMAFLLVPEFPMLAFASALEPLRVANRMAEQTLFEWRLVTLDGRPVAASNGIVITPHESLESLDRPDILVVCVGLEPLQFGRSHKIHHHMRRIALHGAMIGGISSAAFLLADAGLLNERRATVHWEYAELFRQRFPTVKLSRALYVFDREIFTCSGGTAALDTMSYFIGQKFGPQLAHTVAEQFIHPRIRGDEEEQRAEIQDRYSIASARLAKAIELMESALDVPLSLREIAKKVGVSARQVERLFADELQLAPTVFYRQRRLERARALLRQTLQPVRDVALESGFGSTAHLSRAYRKAFGCTPSEERARSRGRSA
ncbi:MAG: GlxA family transcriptional regulator [Gammaproteobacteria bacterium]|nr:GlxA family transcriptional regulator [Gammaproteobacteria bacterium]